jgi:hypothetical protein
MSATLPSGIFRCRLNHEGRWRPAEAELPHRVGCVVVRFEGDGPPLKLTRREFVSKLIQKVPTTAP